MIPNSEQQQDLPIAFPASYIFWTFTSTGLEQENQNVHAKTKKEELNTSVKRTKTGQWLQIPFYPLLFISILGAQTQVLSRFKTTSLIMISEWVAFPPSHSLFKLSSTVIEEQKKIHGKQRKQELQTAV